MFLVQNPAPAPAPAPPVIEIPDPVIVQGYGPPPPWESLPPPVFVLIFLAMIAGAVVILWPLARAFARRIEGRGGDTEVRRELEELRIRVRDLEGEQARFAELEERIDFAERLLAQAREAPRLPGAGA